MTTALGQYKSKKKENEEEWIWHCDVGWCHTKTPDCKEIALQSGVVVQIRFESGLWSGFGPKDKSLWIAVNQNRITGPILSGENPF